MAWKVIVRRISLMPLPSVKSKCRTGASYLTAIITISTTIMYIMGYWGKCQIGHHHHRHNDLHHVVTQQTSAQKLSSSTSKVPVLDVARGRTGCEVGTIVGKARLRTDKEEHVPDRAHDDEGSAGDDDEKTMMIMMMMNMM
eukprot:8671577-Karenia_brevis.AAC.1